MLGTGTTIGDIDGVTGPAFAAVVRDVIDRSDDTLLSVDCSGVTFIDPASVSDSQAPGMSLGPGPTRCGARLRIGWSR